MTKTKTSAGKAAWPWVRRIVCVLGLSALVADGGLRQDEIECEEAVSYVQSCCPGFVSGTVACVHDTGCGVTTDTALSISESECILAESCDEIVATGLCAKVMNLPSPSSDSVDGTSTSHPPVCP